MTSSNQYYTSHFYNVGDGYSVSFSITYHENESGVPSVVEMSSIWNPNIPTPRDFRRNIKINEKYLIARNNYIASISKKTNQNIICFSL